MKNKFLKLKMDERRPRTATSTDAPDRVSDQSYDAVVESDTSSDGDAGMEVDENLLLGLV